MAADVLVVDDEAALAATLAQVIAATPLWSKTEKFSISRLPAPGGLLNHPPRGAARVVWTFSRGHAKSRTSWHVS